MTMTIELSPELEAALEALARARGIALHQYVHCVLKEQVGVPAPELSPAERAAIWLSSVDDLPLRPPLSDEAINRESMYAERG